MQSPTVFNDVLLLRLLHRVNYLWTRAYHRVKVVCPCPIPPNGGGILVCNHISHLDPLVLQSGCNRTIVWMMAREFYELKAMHWLFRRLRAIPVDRSGRDTTATRQAMRALKDGHLLGIFPEGGIGPMQAMRPFHTGAALMALRMKVPVWPARLSGSMRNVGFAEALLFPQEMTLNYGPAIELSDLSTSGNDLETANSRIRSAIASLG